MKKIARIRTDFPTKFGVPRQSGLVPELKAKVVFEPLYRVREAVRGLENFSHIWLLWEFSESRMDGWSPTVRPPRLGGNTRVGVFATRSPFRPNPIGLSVVRLEGVESDPVLGPVLLVSGADMTDGTPIYDIKPYLPYVDCCPEASNGFACTDPAPLTVEIPEECLAAVPAEKREALRKVLAEDPRPAYQDDPERVYGLVFAGTEVRFTVRDGLLRVCKVCAVSAP